MDFIELSGTVVGSETWSQTRVSGSSSGAYIGGIGTSSGRTTSTVTNVSQMWLKTDEGSEIPVRINPDKFAAREGHRVSMLVTIRGNGPAQMIAGVNETTGETRTEGGTAYTVLAVAIPFMTFWIPVLAFFIHPLAGIGFAGFLLWVVYYFASCGRQVSNRSKAFLQNWDNEQLTVDPAALPA